MRLWGWWRKKGRAPEGWVRDLGKPAVLAQTEDGTYTSLTDARRWNGPGSRFRLVGVGAEVTRSFFRRAGRVVRAIEARAITSLPWNVGGAATRGTIHEATRVAPLFAAGRLLATSISSLPLHTYRKVGSTREELPQAPLFVKPGRHGTLRDWLFRCMISLCYTGNAVGWILKRDGFGYPLMIEWLDVNCVHVEDDKPYGPGSFMQPIWRYNGREIPEQDIVHIAWFPIPMKVLGLSPVEAFAAQWLASLSAWEYVGDWFKAGGVPPGTFQNSARIIKPEEANKIKALLVEAIRTHEPLVYGKDWTYTPFTIKPGDAALVELLKLTATDVAAIYGIPAEKIGGQTAGNLTYQTVELQGLDFEQFTLLGWATMLESAFYELLPQPRFVKFNLDAFARADLKSRIETYVMRREIGMNNIDELRAMEDELPLPNGAGASYTPLTVMKAPSVAPTPPAPSPVREEPPADEDRALTGPELMAWLEERREGQPKLVTTGG